MRAGGGTESPTLLSAYHNLAAVLQNKGMVEESEKHYRTVLAIREWSLGSNHPEEFEHSRESWFAASPQGDAG